MLLENCGRDGRLERHYRSNNFTRDDLLKLVLVNGPSGYFDGQHAVLCLIGLWWEGDLNRNKLVRINSCL